jgi:hypothetical protein
MNSQEFVTWLKGFTEGVHEYNITPKQWDLLKERLAEVDNSIVPVGGIISDDNTFRTSGYAQRLDFTTGSSGTAVFPFSGSTLTYTTGTTNRDGLVYTTNPASNVTYTSNGAPNWYSVNKIENDSREK